MFIYPLVTYLTDHYTHTFLPLLAGRPPAQLLTAQKLQRIIYFTKVNSADVSPLQ